MNVTISLGKLNQLHFKCLEKRHMFEIRSPTVYVSFIELYEHHAFVTTKTLQDLLPKNLQNQPRQLMNEAASSIYVMKYIVHVRQFFTPF